MFSGNSLCFIFRDGGSVFICFKGILDTPHPESYSFRHEWYFMFKTSVYTLLRESNCHGLEMCLMQRPIGITCDFGTYHICLKTSLNMHVLLLSETRHRNIDKKIHLHSYFVHASISGSGSGEIQCTHCDKNQNVMG